MGSTADRFGREEFLRFLFPVKVMHDALSPGFKKRSEVMGFTG
jgi:hypothetical protein